jgi:hypothetical protein
VVLGQPQAQPTGAKAPLPLNVDEKCPNAQMRDSCYGLVGLAPIAIFYVGTSALLILDMLVQGYVDERKIPETISFRAIFVKN